MTIFLCVLAVVAALAICVEGLLWVRATRRQLDRSGENLRALLAHIDGQEAGDA